MMKLEQLRHEDTSSGYGSRESLTEGLLSSNKQDDVAVQQPNNYCSRKSGNNRKTSFSQCALSPHCTTVASDIENSAKKSQRHSHSSLLPSSVENKLDNSAKKLQRLSHSASTPALDKEMASFVEKSQRHSHSSIVSTLDHETGMRVKRMHRNCSSSPSLINESKSCAQKSNRHSHSSLTPVLDNEMLIHINKDLVAKNKELVEENSRLLEELQILQHYSYSYSYQGTLNDLYFQLSAGESKIMILQETICTYKEALAERKANAPAEVIQDKEELSSKESDIIEQASTAHILQEKNGKNCVYDKNVREQGKVKCLNNENESEQVMVASIRKSRKTSDSHSRKHSLKSSSLPLSSKSSSSLSPSTKSESSLKLKTSLLQGRNFTKMKEKLVEKNQNLKTDIALLKVMAKAPVISKDTLLPLLIEDNKTKGILKDDVPESKENHLLMKNKSARRCYHKDKNRPEKKNKLEKNTVEIEIRETTKNIFLTQLQHEGTQTLEEHKEKLEQEYKATSDHSTTEASDRTVNCAQTSAG